jgi:hypothetical protein
MNSEEIDFTNARMLRKKAEKRLKEKQQKVDQIIETDVKKLMHELQVHQIELEMQNEELQEAYDTAETALKKYTMLFDFAPLGYFTLDSEGSICDLNFTGAEMLDDKRFSLLDSNFKLFVSEDSLPIFNNFFSEVYTSNAKVSCEVMLGYDKKALCYVYMEGVVIGDDRKCLLSVIDISKYRKKNNP